MMIDQRKSKTIRVVLALAGTTIAASASTQQIATDHPSAVVDCRAGCQGDQRGCRESVMKQAHITAHPGYRLLPETLRVVAHWNASDSPGLIAEPQWQTHRYPIGSDRPYSVTVSPILATCTGVSPHTQGVTFYQLQILEQP